MKSNVFDYKQRAIDIVSKMTLREKIGQVTQIVFNVDNINEACETIRKIQPGSLILCWSPLGGKEEQRSVRIEELNTAQKVAVEETECHIPMLFGRDVIHGHHIAFPVPLTMVQSFDFDLINQAYDSIRQEAISDGVKWTFAPMLDMSHEPRWGRIVEGPGEDPYLGELFAKACINGFQTDNHSDKGAMLACAKHFVGYGASEGGRDYNHTEISDYNLYNNYLPAFRSAVDCEVATMMSAFNDINGVPVTGSKRILTYVLRDELGFNGFVLSDWGGIYQLYAHQGYCENSYEAAKSSLTAGVDMDMTCNCFLNNIEKLLEDQEITVQELDTAVLRILETKLKFGLFENPYAENIGYNKDEHLALAQKLAQESIVLLKNNKNILPLSRNAKVAYCGNFKDEGIEMVGTWSLDFDRGLIKNFRETINEEAPDIDLIDFDDNNCSAEDCASNTDCILAIIGEKREVTGEASSLADISLPKSQIKMLKQLKQSGKPLIGVFCFARPMAFGKDDDLFDAILWCGHGGTKAAAAAVSVLLGDSEPQGRLSASLPHSVGQIPLYYNALPGSRRINGYYGDIDPSIKNYYDCVGAPNYPFGYGLSYTSFKISDFSCEREKVNKQYIESGKKIKVTFSVENTGTRKGICVPQLYIRDLVGSRMRPLRSLIDFKRIALEIGEIVQCEFEIGLKQMGFYSETGEFLLEKGKFELYLGEDCLANQKIVFELI